MCLMEHYVALNIKKTFIIGLFAAEKFQKMTSKPDFKQWLQPKFLQNKPGNNR